MSKYDFRINAHWETVSWETAEMVVNFFLESEAGGAYRDAYESCYHRSDQTYLRKCLNRFKTVHNPTCSVVSWKLMESLSPLQLKKESMTGRFPLLVNVKLLRMFSGHSISTNQHTWSTDPRFVMFFTRLLPRIGSNFITPWRFSWWCERLKELRDEVHNWCFCILWFKGALFFHSA